MTNKAQAAFACGMGYPWTPPHQPHPNDYPMVAYQPPACDHCFCKQAERHSGEGKHLNCCKCGTAMAEKFVKAWFDLFSDKACPKCDGSGKTTFGRVTIGDPPLKTCSRCRGTGKV